MADPKPYHLKNIDVENLDLSQYEKDFTPEELAAVKQALIATRNEHVANYEALPLLDKAGIYANEKFGQVGNYVEENPESLVLAPLAVIGAKAAVDKGRSIFGSLREKMAAPLPDDSLLAEQQRTQAKAPSAPEVPKPISTQTPPPAVSTEKTLEELQAEGRRLDAIHEARVKAAQTNLSAAPTPENPTVPLNTEVGKPPKDMSLVEQSKQNNLKNELANTKKQAETEGAPQSWRNQYNRNKTNPIGPSAFNYLASQVEKKGVETPELARKIWEEQYGPKNVSYEQFMKDWSAAKRPERPGSIGVKPGGSGGTPKFIPEYIRGNASLGGMGSLALMATALGLAGSEKGQAAMAKAANAIKDIGFSPDILTNKAEEMGRLGTGYVTAGNPVYRRELEQKLQFTNDPQYKKVLQEELAKISSSSNSPYRSVPPPR